MNIIDQYQFNRFDELGVRVAKVQPRRDRLIIQVPEKNGDNMAGEKLATEFSKFMNRQLSNGKTDKGIIVVEYSYYDIDKLKEVEDNKNEVNRNN